MHTQNTSRRRGDRFSLLLRQRLTQHYKQEQHFPSLFSSFILNSLLYPPLSPHLVTRHACSIGEALSLPICLLLDPNRTSSFLCELSVNIHPFFSLLFCLGSREENNNNNKSNKNNRMLYSGMEIEQWCDAPTQLYVNIYTPRGASAGAGAEWIFSIRWWMDRR